jgi:hypothetical protein
LYYFFHIARVFPFSHEIKEPVIQGAQCHDIIVNNIEKNRPDSDKNIKLKEKVQQKAIKEVV